MAGAGARDVPVREKQIGGSGGSLEPPGPLLEPPGPLLMHLHTVYIECSECLPTCLNPLAERTCFSQRPKTSRQCGSVVIQLMFWPFCTRKYMIIIMTMAGQFGLQVVLSFSKSKLGASAHVIRCLHTLDCKFCNTQYRVPIGVICFNITHPHHAL